MTNRVAFVSLYCWLVTHLVLATSLPGLLLSTGLLCLALAFALGYRLTLPKIQLPITIRRDECQHKSLSVGAKGSVHCVQWGASLAQSTLQHLDISRSQTFKVYRQATTAKNGKLVEVVEPLDIYQPTLPGITGLKNPFQTLIDLQNPPKQQNNQKGKKSKKKKHISPKVVKKERIPPPAGPLPFKTLKRD